MNSEIDEKFIELTIDNEPVDDKPVDDEPVDNEYKSYIPKWVANLKGDVDYKININFDPYFIENIPLIKKAYDDMKDGNINFSEFCGVLFLFKAKLSLYIDPIEDGPMT